MQKSKQSTTMWKVDFQIKQERLNSYGAYKQKIDNWRDACTEEKCSILLGPIIRVTGMLSMNMERWIHLNTIDKSDENKNTWLKEVLHSLDSLRDPVLNVKK